MKKKVIKTSDDAARLAILKPRGEKMKTRHKTNWERAMSAVDSITGRSNRAAVETLRAELGPKYAAIVARREGVRLAVAEFRKAHDRPETRKQLRQYAANYRAAHREECNRKSSECHKRRRAAEQGARRRF